MDEDLPGPSSSEPAASGPDPAGLRSREPGSPEGVPRWFIFILPYFSDLLLVPVLMALLGHVALLLSALMVWLTRGTVAAAVVLLIMAVGTVQLVRLEVRAVGKLRGVAISLALTWVGSVALTWVFLHYDVL